MYKLHLRSSGHPKYILFSVHIRRAGNHAGLSTIIQALPAILPSYTHCRPFYHHLGIAGNSTIIQAQPAILLSSRHSRPFYHHPGIDGHSTYSTQHGHSMNIYTVLPFYKHLCNAILQSTYGPRAAILHNSTQCRHSTDIYVVPPFCIHLQSYVILHTYMQCR